LSDSERKRVSQSAVDVLKLRINMTDAPAQQAFTMTSDLAQRIAHRINILAELTDTPGEITRFYGSPALREAMNLVETWMQEAGLKTGRDAIGNLVGRLGESGPFPLVIGSHLDSVRNAGAYDGAVGVIAAIEVADALRGGDLTFPLEVVAFADEEGVRFHTTYLGSGAWVGEFPTLDSLDDDGISFTQAVLEAGGNPLSLNEAKRDAIAGYLEIHIEQGPILETLGLPLGVVTAIASQQRAVVEFSGRAGHAGTVPMDLRQDALAGAVQWMGLVEATAKSTPGLVATIGQLRVEPGAPNVIPGRAICSLDLRHQSDAVRSNAWQALHDAAIKIASLRGLVCQWNETQPVPAVQCDPCWIERLRATAGANAPLLVSGAGHDAALLTRLGPVAMLFVRCRGGISHHPDEWADPIDMALAVQSLTAAIRGWAS